MSSKCSRAGKMDAVVTGTWRTYTNKYKGEQVEIALFGGETRRCFDRVLLRRGCCRTFELRAHPDSVAEHRLIHCSSRCDAPDPTGRARVGRRRADDLRRTRRILGYARCRCAQCSKTWLLFSVPASLRSPVGSSAGIGSRCLWRNDRLVAALYFYADRIAMGSGGCARVDARQARASFDG